MRTCRPTAGSAPSRLVASPRRHSSQSRPTSPTASTWAAQWACGSSQSESTNIPFSISTSQRRLGFNVPRHTMLWKKTTANWTLLLAPLSHTCPLVGGSPGGTGPAGQTQAAGLHRKPPFPPTRVRRRSSGTQKEARTNPQRRCSSAQAGPGWSTCGQSVTEIQDVPSWKYCGPR